MADDDDNISMKKKKKKKKKQHQSHCNPVTKIERPSERKISDIVGGGSGKTQRKRRHQLVIARFHTLNKRLHQLNNNECDDDDDDDDDDIMKRRLDIERQINDLGGLEFYQRASLRGQKQGNQGSSKWIEARLVEHHTAASGKWLLLDVGALERHYMKFSSWLNVRSIDLNARAVGIEKCDFFDVDVKLSYDVICLSLVINFVPTPEQRGAMLVRSCNLLRHGGFLAVVLPLPCVENSRHIDEDLLNCMFNALGLHICSQHRSRKLHFSFLQLRNPLLWQRFDKSTSPRFVRKVIRGGSQCNNYSIVF